MRRCPITLDVGRNDVVVQAKADAAVATDRIHLHLHHRIQPVGAGAAVLLGHGHAQEPVLAGLAPDRAIDKALLLPGLMVRRDLVVGETPVAVAKGLVVGRKEGSFNHAGTVEGEV